MSASEFPDPSLYKITEESLSKIIRAVTVKRWEEARAWEWYDGVQWPVGCNFNPSSSINQLEMWQAETFNAEEIDRELGWLAAIGMNTVRVFLHDLLWKQDAEGFLARIDTFLSIADKHGIRTMLVFFDSCWNPYPEIGTQRAPTPGVHNSYWAQSPGAAIVNDRRAFADLEGYVTGVVKRFREDRRVLVWDVWNEPDNINMGTYNTGFQSQEAKGEYITPLLAQTFLWVRSAQPTQPVTSGVWAGDWSSDDKLMPWQKVQLLGSDVTSFHRYTPLEETRTTVEPLKRFKRPLLCTEYVARGAGNTFETILPYFKEEKIAAYNWGAVAGKTQTYYPWTSWEKPFTEEPVPWHHDIFRKDGTPYEAKETALIRKLTMG